MIEMVKVPDNEMYRSKVGLSMSREYGTTPNGNTMNGRWVLRDAGGVLIDFDKYRNDLAERHELKLIEQR